MSIELKPFYNEAEIALSEEFTLRLVIDFAVIDRLEGLLGRGMDTIIAEMMGSVATMGKVLWGVTRKHHSDLTLDHIAGILLPEDPASRETAQAVMATLGDLINRTFNISGGPEDKEGANPPKRSGGASRTSARSGSPRASRPTSSGKRRRAHS